MKPFRFAGMLLLLVALAVQGQNKPQPAAAADLGDAMRRFATGDFAGALAVAKEVVAANPANARAWRVVGVAEIHLKDADAARAAFHKSLEIEPQNPTALYNIGVTYAMQGDRDHAMEWLGKAKATHNVDMTQIETDSDLASLKGDPRFAELLPKPEDFRDPFVEKVKIIREWDGEAAGDQFGWIARKLGDVDGDGIPDIVTSAPTKTIGSAENAGRVYVYSSRTGKLIWSVDGAAGDQLGTGVEAAGDADGDGIADVVASAPGSGKAFIFSGKDGHVLQTLVPKTSDEAFGSHASGVGDVDGDGHADVIVGAPANSGKTPGTGYAYVFSGKDGHVLLRLEGERAGDAFGAAVAGATIGKRVYLLVGAPHAGPRKTGRTYVYKSLTSKPAFVIDSDDTGRALGAMFLSVLGDVNGDHVPDLYASDWVNAAKGPSTGRIYVVSGRDGHTLLTLTGETAGEGFGTCPAVAGDVDGDGHADLIVGAWQYAGAATSGGRAYLYSGADGHLIATFTCRTPGDTFGFDAVGMGDIDGDGTDDLLITSGWSGVHGFHSGRVFLISSGVSHRKR